LLSAKSLIIIFIFLYIAPVYLLMIFQSTELSRNIRSSISSGNADGLSLLETKALACLLGSALDDLSLLTQTVAFFFFSFPSTVSAFL